MKKTLRKRKGWQCTFAYSDTTIVPVIAEPWLCRRVSRSMEGALNVAMKHRVRIFLAEGKRENKWKIIVARREPQYLRYLSHAPRIPEVEPNNFELLPMTREKTCLFVIPFILVIVDPIIVSIHRDLRSGFVRIARKF